MKKTYYMAGGMLALLLLPSCSLFEKISGKGQGEVEKEAILPQDREAIQQQATQKAFNPAELAKGVVTGDWAIEEVYGKKAVGETVPFLKFVVSEGRVYGNNGCNTINSDYSYNSSDSTLTFNNTISTMRMCGKQGITDYDINSALDATRYYSWELKDNDYYLYTYDENHSPLLVMMHQSFDFLNGAWNVKSIAGQPVNIEDMQLVIDIDERKVHGNTGCNILNGTIETDMDMPNSVSFQAIGITRMACPDNLEDAQTQLIVALEDASKAKPLSPGKVAFLDASGKVVLTLERKN